MTTTTIPEPPGATGLNAAERAAGTARAWQLGTKLAEVLGDNRPESINTIVWAGRRIGGEVMVDVWMPSIDDLLRVSADSGQPIAVTKAGTAYLNLGPEEARIAFCCRTEVAAR